MKFDTIDCAKIILLGAGGTGGWAASHICQMCSVLDKPIDIVICDGDIVEEKNLNRQNFISQDVGSNKAKILAERYSAAYGVACFYVPEYIESEERLTDLCKPKNQQLVILVGAVDNNKTRELCDKVFHSSSNLVYIDSGNAEFSGQVICGIRKGGETIFPPASSIYPDLIEQEADDVFPSELSCAARAISSPQTITANIMAATAILCFLFNIVVKGELPTESVEFSAKTISMRTRLHKRKDVSNE